VAGEKPGSKLKKALDLEVEVLEEDDVLRILKQQ
jgi:NAD-dependent DNA ligase